MPDNIFLDRTYPDGSTSIGVIVDSPVPRKGYEKYLPPGVKVGLPGWERAHQVGPGFGAESKSNILYAPKEFNQAYQNRGIEKTIRELFKDKLPDVEIRVMTDAKPHPGTKRLKEITYKVTLTKDGVTHNYFEVTLEIENKTKNPKISIDPDKVILGPAHYSIEQYLKKTRVSAPKPPKRGVKSKAAAAALATALNASPVDAKTNPPPTINRATEVTAVAREESPVYTPDRGINRGIVSTPDPPAKIVSPFVPPQTKAAPSGEVEVGRIAIKYEKTGNTIKTRFTKLDLSGFVSRKVHRLSNALENPIVNGVAKTAGSIAINKLIDYGVDKLKSYYISRIELAKAVLEKEFPSEDVIRSANDIDEKLETINVIMEHRKPFDVTDLPTVKANIDFLTPAFDFENELIDLSGWLNKQVIEGLAPIKKDIEFRAKILTDTAQNIIKALEIIAYTIGLSIAYVQTLSLWNWYMVFTDLGGRMNGLSYNVSLKIREYENMSIHDDVVRVNNLLDEIRPYYIEYANIGFK